MDSIRKINRQYFHRKTGLKLATQIIKRKNIGLAVFCVVFCVVLLLNYILELHNIESAGQFARLRNLAWN